MGRRGPAPDRFPVQGRMMTLRQIAEETGTTVRALYKYRQRHRGPDGRPVDMDGVYRHYRRLQRGLETRHPGRPARKHTLPDGRTLTVAEMAAELGIKRDAMYQARCRTGMSAVEIYTERWKKKRARAMEAIVAVVMEAKTSHDP